METIVYITRHGQTEWNIVKRLQGRKNSPLTQSGIDRAEELAKRLDSINIDKIYTSPIERAYKTAKILKGNKEIDIITHEGLMEMDFGDYEGRTTEDILKENPHFDMDLIMKGDINLCAPNGENLFNVRERVCIAMNEIINNNRGQSILVVAHGITLKALMYYFKDKDVNSEVMGQTTLTKVVVTAENEYNIVFKNDETHFTVKDKKLGW